MRWLDVMAGHIEMDGQPAGLLTAIDITNRKTNEATEGENGRAIPLRVYSPLRRCKESFEPRRDALSAPGDPSDCSCLKWISCST